MARPLIIAAGFSGAIAVLTYASLALVIVAEEQNGNADKHPVSLRGKQAAPSPELLIPVDDTRRKTDPLALAALSEKITNEDDSEESEESEEYRSSRHRELKDNKRQQRKENGNRNNNNKACAGARPQKCGCRNVYQSDYRGNLGTSETGLPCRAWTQAASYPDQGLDDGAVCRNPDAVAGRTWCFVDHPAILWDYCEVKTCDEEDDQFAYEPSYEGTTGTNTDVPGCVTTARYYEISEDIAAIANSFTDDRDRSHFVGGMVRLAAHDFMDYDMNDATNPMGMDGCLDWMSNNNAGLNTIWNEHSDLFHLHDGKYRDISRPDFWVMAANAVIRLTSIEHALDLKPTFYWGRKEASECPGAADRLPTTESCQQVERVFLQRMGMKWKDAVALLGAHTLGRGHSEFSGHHGTWMPNDKAAQVFDKQYYQELVSRSWSPRISSTQLQDWSTGNRGNDRPKMMLNTDICLFYDIQASAPCCTRTNLLDRNGVSRCETDGEKQCTLYDNAHPHWNASMAVRKYLGGSLPNDDNSAFYDAFKLAWYKATINGMDNLKPVMDTC